MQQLNTLLDKVRGALSAAPRVLLSFCVGLALLILLVYYPIGMLVVQKIDDRDQIDTSAFDIEGGSAAVSMAMALIDREVHQNSWTPNDPFFYPGAALTRMPAFQRGVASAVARFSIELRDELARARGSSQIDKDLQEAVGLLNYSPYVWMFDLKTSWLPTASTETQYRAGIEALRRYNTRLSKGQAVFDRRADNLNETINRMASDLGSSSATLGDTIQKSSGFSFLTSADAYYFAKGRMVGTYLLLSALQKDFPNLIEEKQLATAWGNMQDNLREGMQLDTLVVINAAPDSQFFPNHLAAQGFYLTRARTQMREVADILLK